MSVITNAICLLIVLVLSGPLTSLYERYFGKYLDQMSITKSILITIGILAVDLAAIVVIIKFLAHGQI